MILSRLLRSMLIGVSAFTLSACAEQDQSTSVARLLGAAECRKLVRHELDGDDGLLGPTVSDRTLALEACHNAIVADPASPEAYERLAVIYATPVDGAGPTTAEMASAITNFQMAASRGSTYAPFALAHLAWTSAAGAENLTANAAELLAKARDALAPKANEGVVAAQILYVDLLLRRQGGLADPDANGTAEELSRIASGDPKALPAYQRYLAKRRECRLIIVETGNSYDTGEPPTQNIPACNLILRTAASSGDAESNLNLGLFFLEDVRATYRGKQDGWQERTQESLRAGRSYLVIASNNDNGEIKLQADKLIASIDSADLSGSSRGSEGAAILAGLFALALAGGAESGNGATSSDRDQRSREYDELRQERDRKEAEFRSRQFGMCLEAGRC